MPLNESQVRIIVQAWERPDLAYDVDWLVLRLMQIANQERLGLKIPDALRDAINDGYLYVDQITKFNAFSGYRAFLGLTESGRQMWQLVFPTAEPQR